VERELEAYQKSLVLLKEKQMAELLQQKEAEAKKIAAEKEEAEAKRIQAEKEKVEAKRIEAEKEMDAKEKEKDMLRKAREISDRRRSEQVEVIDDDDEADAPPAKVSQPSLRSSSN
jgi:hypothetical protein